MKKEKISASSKILKRDFFLDFFSSKEEPDFLIMYYGGSGIDATQYAQRYKTIIPVFDSCFLQLEQELAFAFCYVSSPPDINILNLANCEEESQCWLEHIQTEVMLLLPDLPFYFLGYSGGLALATCGMHISERCFGGGALGGDQFPKNLKKGVFWKEPLALYYNLSDKLYQVNAGVISELQENEIVRFYRRLPGTHDLQDYLINESFSGLIRRAGRLFVDRF